MAEKHELVELLVMVPRLLGETLASQEAVQLLEPPITLPSFKIKQYGHEPSMPTRATRGCARRWRICSPAADNAVMNLLSHIADGVLTLTLNRPERLNAIDDALARALLDALNVAALASEVRVIVLRGVGRSFCAGRDVSEPPTEAILERVQAVARALICCPQPVVVGVQGWAVGAGVEWMLDADLAIGARSARFKLPEAGLGVFVTGGISAILPRVAGLARAKAVLMLGDTFSAEDAERWGVIARVVDDAALDAEVEQVARRLAAVEPAVMGRFKRVLNRLGLADAEAALTLESAMQRELMARAGT